MELGTRTEKAFRYQPPLDGVRAVAVLAVVSYHYGFGDGGYLGVDVFLVLSGFLITSLLAIETSTTGRIDFLRFWGRRARRLLPALLVLLVLVGLYAALEAPPEQWPRIRSDGLATLFYVQNWHLVWAGAQSSPLSHTWSLAIEEQWYLFWPPVFLGLTWLCRGRERLLVLVVLVLALASASEMAMLGATGRAYWGTDTRAQSLLLGAALALLLRLTPGPVRRASRVALEIAGLAGLVVFAAMAASPPAWMYQGGFFVVAIASACVVAASVQSESRVLRPVLSLTPLRWLGLISYGVYLYHFLILRWLSPSRTGLSVVPLSLLRFTVTVLLASASYIFIELPVRRGTLLPRRMQVVLMPVAVALVAVVLVVTTTGAPAAQVSSRNERLWTYMRTTSPRGVRRVLLLGDKEAAELALTMQGPYDSAGVRGLGIGSTACRLEDLSSTANGAGAPECRAWMKVVREAIGAYRPRTVVLLFGSSARSSGPRAATSPERAARIHSALEEVRTLRPHAQIALLTPPCAGTAPTPDPASSANDRVWLTAVLHDSAAGDPKRVRVLDYGAALCAGDVQRGTLDGEELRSPAGSLTPSGARAIWRWITERLPAPA